MASHFRQFSTTLIQPKAPKRKGTNPLMARLPNAGHPPQPQTHTPQPPGRFRSQKPALQVGAPFLFPIVWKKPWRPGPSASCKNAPGHSHTPGGRRPTKPKARRPFPKEPEMRSRWSAFSSADPPVAELAQGCPGQSVGPERRVATPTTFPRRGDRPNKAYQGPSAWKVPASKLYEDRRRNPWKLRNASSPGRTLARGDAG